MKLYELPRDSRFTLVDDDSQTVFMLERIDGMYSRCYLGDALVHIGANADVEEVSDEYVDTAPLQDQADLTIKEIQELLAHGLAMQGVWSHTHDGSYESCLKAGKKK